MDVSVIIVNYNTKELIRNCIQSIYDKTVSIEYEIIVVDNNSQDGSQKMIKDLFPDVILIELDENIGFGRANNEGAKITRGQFLFFLNSDTLLLDNAICFLYNQMLYNDMLINSGVIGLELLDSGGRIGHSYGRLPNLTQDIISEIKGLLVDLYGRRKFLNRKLSSTPAVSISEPEIVVVREVGYVTGADMFLRKDIFQSVQGFDPFFFMYFEESDFQFRLNKLGFKHYIINFPSIKHLEGASFDNKKTNNLRRICYDNSHYYYYKKHFPIVYFWLYSFFHGLMQLLSIFNSEYPLKERLKYIGIVLTHKSI